MYSLVLMAAVTAAPETPSKFFSCFSCGTGCNTSYSCGTTSHCGWGSWGCLSKFCDKGNYCAPVTCAPACAPAPVCAAPAPVCAPTCAPACNTGCSVNLCGHGCGFSLCGKTSGCDLCGKFWGCGLFSKCFNKGGYGYSHGGYAPATTECGSVVVPPVTTVPPVKDVPKDMPKDTPKK